MQAVHARGPVYSASQCFLNTMALFTTILSSSMTLERRLAQRRHEEAARSRVAALRAAQAQAAKVPTDAAPADLHPTEILRRSGKVHHR